MYCKLENLITFCDLGGTVDSQLNYNFHINDIVLKSNKLLAFIMRTSFHFDSLGPVVVHLKLLISSKLEYCAIIWSSYLITATTLRELKKVFSIVCIINYIIICSAVDQSDFLNTPKAARILYPNVNI